MQAFAMIGVDRPLSQPGVGGGPHSSPVARTGRGQFVGQRLVDCVHELLLLLPDISFRVTENLDEFGRRVIDACREREDGIPAFRGGRLLAQSFVKLRHADQGEKIGLIDGEGILDRRPFASGIADYPLRRREIDPVRPFAGLAFAGDFEMHDGRSCVGPRKSVGTEPIAGCRLLLVDQSTASKWLRAVSARPARLARAASVRCWRMPSTDMPELTQSSPSPSSGTVVIRSGPPED